MNPLTFLLALVALLLGILALRENGRLRESVDRLRESLRAALRRLAELEQRGPGAPGLQEDVSKPEPETEPAPTEAPPFAPEPAASRLARLRREREPELAARQETVLPPPLPPALVEPITATASPPPLPPLLPPTETAGQESPAPASAPARQFDWEQFLGVKGLAWIAGFALFLGVVFFLKYSFEKGWVTPAMRTIMGFLTGIGLVVGGAWLQRRKFSIPSQALCASGTVILYATTFAARSLYHLIPTGLAFAVMSVITVAAFALAVRFNARVIAVLGLFGGFLTPILVSTGEDNPLGLFTYVALLDAGLLAVALRQRWNFLAALGAAGTVLMQLAWMAKFFEPEAYFAGAKTLVPFAVFLGFSGLFVAALWQAKRREMGDEWFLGPAIALPVVALLAGFYFLGFDRIAERPALVFAYVLLADAGLLALAWMDRRAEVAPAVGGVLAFGLLTDWTARSVTPGLMNTGLTLYLLFGAVHAVEPLVRQRFRPDSRAPWWSNAWALLALALMLLPIMKLAPTSLTVWLFVLLVDLLVIGLAIVSGLVVWVVAALVLTLLSVAGWVLVAPAGLDRVTGDLLVVALFAGVFIAAGIYLARKLAGKSPPDLPFPTGPRALWSNDILLPRVPALAAVMPFALLALMTLRLPLVNPSPVFGLALLLTVLLLGLARYFRLGVMPAVGLLAVLAVEHLWYFARFTEPLAGVALAWFVGFTLVFTAYPFVFWRELKEEIVPWVAAALAAPLHFYLVHDLVRRAWPNSYMGVLPALFALPALAGLCFLVKHLSTEDGRRNTQLALFGGAALFFITLIFPLQFSKQWLTLSWAFEGVALLWLFHRVPHPGLRLTGLALLATCFVRLMNPLVLGYYARADAPIFNWYLYTYGLTVFCCFVAARLLAPPRDEVFGHKAPPLLQTLGAILAFALVNLQIADYFTPAGATRLVFEFTGNFARDMTYTIAWAVFALVLVVVGVVRRLGPCRWAGMGLLLVTLAKLFLHDLARLDALYRVGAFVAVAVIAFAASFLYQRHFAQNRKATQP